MARECRRAPSRHGIIAAPAGQSPNQTHQTKRWQGNVAIKDGIATDRPLCYRFRLVRGGIRGISGKRGLFLRDLTNTGAIKREHSQWDRDGHMPWQIFERSPSRERFASSIGLTTESVRPSEISNYMRSRLGTVRQVHS